MAEQFNSFQYCWRVLYKTKHKYIGIFPGVGRSLASFAGSIIVRSIKFVAALEMASWDCVYVNLPWKTKINYLFIYHK